MSSPPLSVMINSFLSLETLKLPKSFSLSTGEGEKYSQTLGPIILPTTNTPPPISKILRKFLFLSETEQSKLIETKISSLGGKN